MIKNELNLNLEVIIFKDGDYYIAYAPALDFSAYGDSEEDAKSSFDTSIKLMFDEVIQQGTLEKMLLMYGWQLVQKPIAIYSPPAYNPQALPFSLSSIVGNDQIPVTLPTSQFAYA